MHLRIVRSSLCISAIGLASLVVGGEPPGVVPARSQNQVRTGVVAELQGIYVTASDVEFLFLVENCSDIPAAVSRTCLLQSIIACTLLSGDAECLLFQIDEHVNIHPPPPVIDKVSVGARSIAAVSASASRSGSTVTRELLSLQAGKLVSLRGEHGGIAEIHLLAPVDIPVWSPAVLAP